MNLFRSLMILAMLFLGVARTTQAATTPPNIIVVFIDDMGWGDFSCFGNLDAKTPHIDRMATEGIAFEQFYVNSPICSPSRVAISTGQYPLRWGITSYLAHRKVNAKRGIKNWLDPKAPMLARSLKQAGYHTGHFGKWHMGGQRDVTEAPQINQYGFDVSLTNFEGMGAKLLPLTQKPDPKQPGKIIEGRIWEQAVLLGEPVTWMQRSEITAGFVDAAVKFIDQSQLQSKPFYLNLWPDDVHSPFFPPVKKWGPTKRELYLAVLEEMDRQLGVLFDHVRSNAELRENTLILICSDNGPELGAGQAANFKGYKTHLFEGGIRSPLIAWGPGFISKPAVGSRNKASVFSAIDLTPSLLKLAGVAVPKDVNYDGEELLDVIVGKSNQSRKQPLYFCRPPDRKNYYGFNDLPDLAIRSGYWKLLCDYDGGRPLLYNLSKDAGEQNNVATANPAITNQLTQQVTQWYTECTQ